MKETVGFIGLGGMGLAMATNLLKAGFGLRVYNRTAEKARPLLELGAILARSPAEAAEPGGVVVTMVSDDRARRGSDPGHERLAGPPGRRRSPLDEHDRAADRAPSGGPPPGARRPATSPRRSSASPRWRPQAKLWVVTSGDAAARARVRPLQEAMGQRVFDFGDDPGAANVIKLAGNFLLGAAIEAMAEAFTLAQKHGVPRQQTYEFFRQTLFDCFVYRGYGELVASEHYQPVGATAVADPQGLRADPGGGGRGAGPDAAGQLDPRAADGDGGQGPRGRRLGRLRPRGIGKRGAVFPLRIEDAWGYDAVNNTNIIGATHGSFDTFRSCPMTYLWYGNQPTTDYLRALNSAYQFNDPIGTVVYIENHDHTTITFQAGGRDWWFRVQPHMIALPTWPSALLIANGQEFGRGQFLLGLHFLHAGRVTARSSNRT